MFLIIQEPQKFIVPQPYFIEQCSSTIGGVNYYDNLVDNYTLQDTNSWEKWWWLILTTYIYVRLCTRLCSETKKYLLDFRCEVALSLLQAPFQSEELPETDQQQERIVSSACKRHYMENVELILPKTAEDCFVNNVIGRLIIDVKSVMFLFYIMIIGNFSPFETVFWV